MGNGALRISVLDATAVGPGVTAGQAVQWTAQIAQMAETLGYHRLWVVEHHGVPGIGCGAPAVLLAYLGSITRTLRLGAGGVMLPNHSPVMVGEEFALLHALFPGRIDLGVGRGGGSDPKLALALRRARSEDQDFSQQLDELDCVLNRDIPDGHPWAGIKLSLEVDAPPVFLLGSSMSTAHLAAERGVPFAFPHHLMPELTGPALAAYRQQFRRRGALAQPYAIITVAAVGAPTQEQADHAAFVATVARLRIGLALRNGLEVSADVIQYPHWSVEERRIVAKELSGAWILVGDPGRLRAGMANLRRTTGADEIMLATIEYDGADRVRTLRAASDALGPSPG